MTDWYLGTMGFSYKQWDGPFYPAGLARRAYLPYYAERYNAVEMDSTFYATPAEKTVLRWYQTTPPAFRICPKVPRAITHERRLRGVADELAHFLTTMALLREKLGAILIQLPPEFTPDEVDHLQAFLALLPSDQRFAVEFRHPAWAKPATAELLRAFNVCWVSADYIHLPHDVTPTSDFLYLRFLGRHGQFPTKDREQVDKTEVLQAWYARIQPHLPQLDTIYGFFNNDYAGFSPATCNKFKRIVGLPPAEIRPMQQGRLL